MSQESGMRMLQSTTAAPHVLRDPTAGSVSWVYNKPPPSGAHHHDDMDNNNSLSYHSINNDNNNGLYDESGGNHDLIVGVDGTNGVFHVPVQRDVQEDRLRHGCSTNSVSNPPHSNQLPLRSLPFSSERSPSRRVDNSNATTLQSKSIAEPHATIGDDNRSLEEAVVATRTRRPSTFLQPDGSEQEGSRAVITNRPTLLPSSDSFIKHESTESAHDFSITSTIADRYSTRPNESSSEPGTSEFTQIERDSFSHDYSIANNLVSVDTTQQQQQLQQQQQPLVSTAQSLSGLTMGYSSFNNTSSAWNNEQKQQQEKSMESSSIDSTQDAQNVNEQKNRDDDETTVRSIESEIPASPVVSPRTGAAYVDRAALPSQSDQGTGTPSTVSTAPETDEASLGGEAMERLALRADAAMFAGELLNNKSRLEHRRVPSWEFQQQQQQQQFFPPSPDYKDQSVATGVAPPVQQQSSMYTPATASSYPVQPPLMASAWGMGTNSAAAAPHSQYKQQHPLQQPRVASFREDNRWSNHHHQQQQPSYIAAPRGMAGVPHMYRQQGTPTAQGSMLALNQQGMHPGSARKPPGSYNHTGAQPQPTPNRKRPPQQGIGQSPNRTGQSIASASPRSPSEHIGQSPHRSGNVPVSGGGARSPSEILKTLLRKKACLYEADTSRAVALVTWLVGRILALEHGFFSRQQLQAGVHACVGEKIESGVITRTKVNRCMQIILNSCFHYIIPRPDGTEESGESFRNAFAGEVGDDSFLLRVLPKPWNSMVVDRATVLNASDAEISRKSFLPSTPEATPTSSPRLSGIPDAHAKEILSTPLADGMGDVGPSSTGDSKRAVLLCFNENVRRAEDVFRCHNEFIRDTARASSLQLSSHEWIQFFGKEAAMTPYLWGNIGIPVPFREGHGPERADALGVMTKEELGSFRTCWCAKRYDHDHELCGFAHSEVNGGWLRRNPYVHSYRDELCSSVRIISEPSVSPKPFILNECPQGIYCEYAHSYEEITYHPRRYKMKLCSNSSRPGGCYMGDACPHFHPIATYRFPKKADGRSPRHGRQSQQQQANRGDGANNQASKTAPAGSPILYAGAAPLSSFDQQLVMPGLQSLFRRQSSVVRAYLIGMNNNNNALPCTYNLFGDDASISFGGKTNKASKSANAMKTIGDKQVEGGKSIYSSILKESKERF